MSEEKIIAALVQEHDIKTTADIHEALKELLDGAFEEIPEAELDAH